MAAHDSNRKIDDTDLAEYLATQSGFAFELQCLRRLHTLGYQCRHGGSYSDPVTRKIRQFDIRARKSVGSVNVWCAIECKHISESFPLLVTCVPRRTEESFHDVLFTQAPEDRRQGLPVDTTWTAATTKVRIKSPHSPYREGKWVGKTAAQVGRTKGNDIYGTDEDAFDKWSQALASADEMATEAVESAEHGDNAAVTIIVPILAVPNGRLWQAFFDEHGRQVESPFWTDRCSMYVDRGYSTGFIRPTNFTISHLEIVTLAGIESLLREVEKPDGMWLPLSKLCSADECAAT
jgi:hypothetical protein